MPTGPLSELLRNDGEVKSREDEVHEEDEHEGDDDGPVDRFADPFGATLRVETEVAGDHRRDQPEDPGFTDRDHEVCDLGQEVERGEIRTGRTSLDDDVEEVAPGDAGHGDEAVEEHRDEDRGPYPRNHEGLDRVDGENLHRRDLVSDLPGPDVG